MNIRARIIGSIAAAIVVGIVTYLGVELSEEQKGSFTLVVTNVIETLVGLLTYSAIHRKISAKSNPADVAVGHRITV